MGGVFKKDMKYFNRIGHVCIAKWPKYEISGTEHCYECKVL